jgi:hypothetical protein
MKRQNALLVAIMVLALPISIARAELTDATQTTPNVPGGAIGKSLEQQVGAGRGDELTPGSSIYLILSGTRPGQFAAVASSFSASLR